MRDAEHRRAARLGYADFGARRQRLAGIDLLDLGVHGAKVVNVQVGERTPGRVGRRLGSS